MAMLALSRCLRRDGHRRADLFFVSSPASMSKSDLFKSIALYVAFWTAVLWIVQTFGV